MTFTGEIMLACAGLLVGMLLMVRVGVRAGGTYAARHENQIAGTVQNAAFGMLGLLVAFSFYGATGRLDYHRQLTVDEANAVSTVNHRIDLLPEAAQPAIRASLVRYLETRIELYRSRGEPEVVQRGRATSDALEQEIWREARAACDPSSCPASTVSLVFSSLNTMFDLATKQMMGTLMHPPLIVFVMLFALALICSYLVGFDLAVAGKPRSWTHLLAVPLMLAVIIFVVLDIEFPRRGVIRLDNFDQLLATMRDRVLSAAR